MKIQIDKVPVFIKFISEENFESIENLQKTSKKKSYRRSLRLKKIIEKITKEKKLNTSISHTKNHSGIAYCFERQIGLDIEDINRPVSNKLTSLLREKAEILDLNPLELWTLMESTYKSKKLKKSENFLDYKFEKINDIYVYKFNNLCVQSKIRKFKNLCVSVSLLG